MKDDDYKLIDENSRAFLQEPMRASGLLLFAIILFVIMMIVWAYFAEIDERTSAEGVVIPSSQVQEIQNLEGGILSELFVREGDIVDKKQVILRIDDTRFTSDFEQSQVKYYALLAELARLQAEAKGSSEIAFPKVVVEKYPEIVEHEKELFAANRANYNANLSTLRRSYELGLEQLQITEPLAEEGIVSKLELLKLKKEINEAKGKIETEDQTYLANVNEQIVDLKSELDALNKSLSGLKDRMTRTTIQSPVYGIVKKIYITTIGGVIQPGENILEIVPLEDQLLIEAKVLPENIGFIHPGQEADIKITAYDSSIYGSIKGNVKYISADAIIEEDERGIEESFYKVLIKTTTNHILYAGEELPIIPGMQVTADILTGKKTILNYIFKPIIKARQRALREK